ncbi:putative NBD/HSP70 family sugar kinase [Rhizobium sp. BK529]|uniref:ROK family transcriptional regulator n=1 Tax=Rhizobium sp. BK529 TaxID=2586983 RepID=UPI00161AF29F|nr:ROK family transcriptional regulator [Rhizobium sp. BK529]MBB3594935.1 putative NBD/HSP70 family sugar kinase [Rhizobium sp. BK529]
MTVATSAGIMREANALTVLRTVEMHDGLSRVEIGRMTGLSKPTVNAIVADLVAREYFRETVAPQIARVNPGPQANHISFNPTAGLLVGYDLSKSRLRASLSDLRGTVLASEEIHFERAPEADVFLDLLIEVASKLCALVPVGNARIWAGALGLPGFLDRTNGTIQLAPGFEHWVGFPFRDVLFRKFENAFGRPVMAGGRAQFGMLAEHRHGAARDIDDAVYVHLGNGIGMGMLVRGEVYEGSSGFAGEIGSMPSDDQDFPDGLGSFEWSAGGLAFARLARKVVEQDRSPSLKAACGGDLSRLNAEMVFVAARSGDNAAQEIVSVLLDRTARGLAAVCCVLNPAKIIVGGGLVRAGGDFVGDLGKRIASLVPFPVEIQPSALTDRASVLGAIEQASRLVKKEKYFLFPDKAAA